MPALPRLPYADLRRFIGATRDTNAEIAAILGLSRGGVLRHQRDGIPLWTADELACRLGVHPVAIWGERWWEAGREYEQRVLAPRDWQSREARRQARASVAA